MMYRLFTDGCISIQNQTTLIGGYIENETGQSIVEFSKSIEGLTNNFEEIAFLHGLELLVQLDAKNITTFTDLYSLSEFINSDNAKQKKHLLKANDEKVIIYQQIIEKLKSFEQQEHIWIPGKQNIKADKLSRIYKKEKINKIKNLVFNFSFRKNSKIFDLNEQKYCAISFASVSDHINFKQHFIALNENVKKYQHSIYFVGDSDKISVVLVDDNFNTVAHQNICRYPKKQEIEESVNNLITKYNYNVDSLTYYCNELLYNFIRIVYLSCEDSLVTKKSYRM